MLFFWLGTLAHGTLAHGRASAILPRAVGGAVGATWLPLLIAELTDCHTVVALSASLPCARMVEQDWRRNAVFDDWSTIVVKSGEPIPSVQATDRRTVYFCSFASAPQLALTLDELEKPVDLLVSDTSGMHPRAAPRAMPAARAAGHDGFLSARRRLFLNAASPAHEEEAEEAALRRSEETECVISESGSSCFGTGTGTGTSAASMPSAVDAYGPWQGPVCRRFGADGAEARLAITAPSLGLLLLTPMMARDALRKVSLAQEGLLLANLDEARARLPPTPVSELALAVLYALLVA